MSENVPSVVNSDEFIQLEEYFELRPDIRVVVSTRVQEREKKGQSLGNRAIDQ